jgi:hypothetical protein
MNEIINHMAQNWGAVLLAILFVLPMIAFR